MKRRPFLKLVASILVFTFSWSQLLYAADVRQMILDAKLLFEQENSLKAQGVSPQELSDNQATQQSVIDHAQDLEDLQDMTHFSLTTQNGDILNYVGNKLSSVKRPDGTLLKNVLTDSMGRILSADLKLSDGSVQIYQNGEVIAYETPDGNQILYQNGVIQKVVSKDGTETSYTYTRDSSGKVTQTILNNANFQSEYDAAGLIKKVTRKSDNQKTSYLNGIIQSIVYSDSSQITFKSISYGNDFKIVFDSFKDAQGLTFYAWPQTVERPFEYLLYRQDHSLKEALSTKGDTLSFDTKGSLTKIVDDHQNEVTLTIDESSLSNMLGTHLEQNGLLASYDAQGHLSSVKIDDTTIHYDTASHTIDYLEKEDGTKLYDLTFDSQGSVKGALIMTPEGEERTYADGKLILLQEPDGTILFYFDDKPTKLITNQKLTYHFSYTPGDIEALLDADLDLVDALTPIQMQYNTDFSLKKMIRQNNEILSYLGGDLTEVMTPGEAPKVFDYVKDASGKVMSYTVTQADVKSFFDASNTLSHVVISPTASNSHTLDVSYQYGKIRQIQKDGVLTFKYSYSADNNNLETTRIEDLEEHLIKDYQAGLLLSSVSTDTSVISSYEYVSDKVSVVKVTRFGRLLHSYSYLYQNNDTLVTDEENVIRTYSSDKKMKFLDKDGQKFTYSYSPGSDGNEIVEERLIEKKLSNNARVTYDEKGVALTIVLADQSVIRDLILDSSRSLVKATLYRTDGIQSIFNASEVIEEIHPDGTHLYFDKGQVTKVLDTQGVPSLYTYDKDASGNITTVWVNKEGVDYKYNTAGSLLGVSVKEAAREGGVNFYDYSSQGKTVTPGGQAQISNTQAKIGNYSAVFDGSGDNLKMDYSDDFNFGTGDFTIEMDLKFDYLKNCSIFDRGVGRGYQLEYTGGKLAWTDLSNGVAASRKIEGWSAALNTWYHLAVTRSNQTLHFFIDGKELGSGTGHSVNLSYSYDLYLGSNADYSNAFSGSMDEVRVSKGVARYTANFNPPAQPFTADTQTKLLLHFDNSSQSAYSLKEKKDSLGKTTGFDMEGSAATLSYDALGNYLSTSWKTVSLGARTIEDAKVLSRALNVQGDALLTASPKFGTDSVYFDGQYDFLTMPSSADLDFGTEDFTVETWIKFNGFNANNMPFDRNRNGGLGDYELNFNNTSKKLTWGDSGILVKQESWSPTLNTWYHVAAVRSLGAVHLYVNGAELGTATPDTHNIMGPSIASLGADIAGNWGVNGWMDEFRLSKTARYTANFTPSNAIFTPDNETSILLHFDNTIKNALNAFATNSSGKLVPMKLLAYREYMAPGSVVDPNAGSNFQTSLDGVLSSDSIVVQEYSSTGVLETQTKADGTVTLFDDNNRPSQVLDSTGDILIEYTYDADGHPSRVYLKNARDKLPDEIAQAKKSIEDQRAQTLLNLAKQKNLAYQSIEGQAEYQRRQLLSQSSALKNQYNELSGTKVSGKKAKNERGSALNQIDDALSQVNGALTQIASQEADSYAQLDASVKSVSDAIESDAKTAYAALDAQEDNLKKEILKQEISPIVYDYYRRILGRDPSSLEYDSWIQKIDYSTGKFITGQDKKVTTTDIVKPGVSVSLDGSGDYLSASDSDDFDFGTGDFTVETWIKFNGFNLYNMPFDRNRNDGVGDYELVYYGSSNKLTWGENRSVVKQAAWTASLNTWYHLAVVRSSGYLHLYVNGIELGTGTPDSSNITGQNSISVGSDTTGNWGVNGWMDNARISKGIARYNGNFTPATDQFTADSYTKLLLAYNSVSGTFLDKSTSPHALTPHGNVALDATQYKTQFKETQTTTTYTPITDEVTHALKQSLESSTELVDRTAYVNTIKQNVSLAINSYLSLTQSQKESFAAGLGLTPQDLIPLTTPDAQKILSWLNTRSLHFGQSAFLALENLLDQKGITYSRIELAQKAVLIDVLTGVISPLDDGDLVISVFALNKVAAGYGLTLSGANLAWENLLKIYETNPTARVIAHINGNHYVVITGVTQDTITYIDPGIGTDKQNESLKVTKNGFMKVWKGNVTLEQSKIQALPDYQNKVLSAQQTQQIRGAFWGSILGLIGSILVWIPLLNPLGLVLTAISAVVSGIEGDWISAISAIVTLGMAPNGLGTFFNNAFHGVTQSMGALGQMFNAVGGFITNVYNAVTGFSNAMVNGIGGFLHGALGVSSHLAADIAKTAVGIGVNFGVSKGLESVGINPEIAGFLGSLAAGAVIGGMKTESAVTIQGETHIMVSHAQYIQQSVSQVLTLSNVGRLGVELGLDPAFTNIIGLSLGAIQGIQIVNPGTTLEMAFSEITPQLSASLAQYGVEKLGASIGIDSRISALIGAPISSGIGVGLRGGANMGQNIMNAINDGFSRGIISMAIEYAGQSLNLNPLLTGLSARAIMGGLEGMLSQSANQGVGFFNGILQGVGNSLFNALTFDQTANPSPMANAVYLQRILRFSDIIKSKGIEAAIEDHLTAILQRDAVETVLKQGGIAQLISHQAVPIADSNGNTVSIKIATGQDSAIYLDPSKQNIIGRDYGNIKERGTYGIDPQTGEFKLLNGRLYQDFSNGFNVIYIKNGVMIDIIPVSNSGDFTFRLSSRDPNVRILIDQYHFDGVVENVKDGTKTTIQDGQVKKIEKINPTSTQNNIDDTAKVAGYQNNTQLFNKVLLLPGGEDIVRDLRNALSKAGDTHGFSFGGEYVTSKTPMLTVAKTPYGILEESSERGYDYLPEGKLTLIGKEESAFKVTLSGSVSASYDGDTSASLTINASGQTQYQGIALKGGGFGEFEGDLNLITEHKTYDLLQHFSGTFKKGVHTETTIQGGPTTAIDTYIEGNSIIQKSTVSDKDGFKSVYYTKFTPQNDSQQLPISDPVLQNKVKAMTVLYDLLSGNKTAFTQVEKDSVSSFMYNGLSQAQQSQNVQISNLSIIAAGFAEAMPTMMNDFSRQLPNIVLGSLSSGVTGSITFNPVNLRLIFGDSLLTPIFSTD